VIFTTHNLPFQEILTAISRVHRPEIEFKMVPDHLEFMIGKSNVERLDALPLVDIEFSYGKPFNKIVKRNFDISLAFVLVVLLLPYHCFNLINAWKSIKKIQLVGHGGKKITVFSSPQKHLNFTLNLLNILIGKISFVGAPMTTVEREAPIYDYKPGLTGIVQINRDKITDDEMRKTYEAHYIKNQGLFVDLEILIKMILG